MNEQTLFDALLAAGVRYVTLEDIQAASGNFMTAEIYFDACEKNGKDLPELYSAALAYYPSKDTKEAVGLQVAKLWHGAIVEMKESLKEKWDEYDKQIKIYNLDFVEFVRLELFLESFMANYFHPDHSTVPEKLAAIAQVLKNSTEHAYLGDFLNNLLGWIHLIQQIYSIVISNLRADPSTEQGMKILNSLSTFLGGFTVGSLIPIAEGCVFDPKVTITILQQLREFRLAIIRESELFQKHSTPELEAFLKENEKKVHAAHALDQQVHLAEIKEYESRQRINAHLMLTVFPKVRQQPNLLKLFHAYVISTYLHFNHFEILMDCFKAYVDFDTAKQLFAQYFRDRLAVVDVYIAQKREVDVSHIQEKFLLNQSQLAAYQKPTSCFCF